MIKYWLQKIWLLFYFSIHGEWKLVREEWKMSKQELDEAAVRFEELDRENRKRIHRWLNHLTDARKKDPKGKKCFFCKGHNDFVDELGFFYINPDPKTDVTGGHPCCEKCYEGEPGKKHKYRLELELIAYGPITLLKGGRGLYEKVLEAEEPV